MNAFFENVFRYPRYFITFVLGIFYSIYQWLRPKVRNRLAAVALFGFFASTFAFVTFTLRLMTGQVSG
mgnify:CR=1 FL=1